MSGKVVDITGQRFERWSVLEEAGRDKHWNALWKCQCDCGSIRIVSGTNLRRGITKSCGCLRSEATTKANRIDLTGQCFGRLMVLEYAYTKKNYVYWVCVCFCGNETVVRGHNLRNNNVKSCGCLKSEMLFERNYIDGRSSAQDYAQSWCRENKDKCNASTAMYKARKRKQTSPTANLNLIHFYYTVSVTMKDYEVDHIKPLSKGGLHHEDNLQLLPRHLNLSKSNKWPLTVEEKIRYKGIRL